MRGDDLLQGEHVDFIKIDTEGMELEVLEGFRGTITSHRPSLFVEVETKRNQAGFFRFLASVGYQVDGEPIVDDECTNYFAVPQS
jgi:hypothetical protein